MLTKVKTAALSGIDGYVVRVETDLHRGLPGIHIVGLADTMIKEAYQRIKPAVRNIGYRFPGDRITVNLVPASEQKEGSHFDLPMAVGIILLTMEMDGDDEIGFLGELSLDGQINPVKGVLPMVMALRNSGVKKVVLPRENAEEAALLEGIDVLPASNLGQVIDYLLEDGELELYIRKKTIVKPEDKANYSHVIGQEYVKRALTIGVAGNHGVLLMGSPGCGKTMMAKRLPSIMPEMTFEEKLEVTSIHSVAGLLKGRGAVLEERPFRAPHHGITVAGLLGGGGRPKPGELTLAHNGVLFLDELGEFEMKTIDALREPIENGFVILHRGNKIYRFPSKVMLVVASNPCKCGHLWDEKIECTCSSGQLNSYRKKLLGPFADRVDIHVRVNSVSWEYLKEESKADSWMSSEEMKAMVCRARKIQEERYRSTGYKYNGSLDEYGIREFCSLDGESKNMLNKAYEKYGLTMRARNKLIKIARTIADLEEKDRIEPSHMAEAVMYRGIK